MKLRIQAQHLQPGDIVGSGEKVISVVVNSTQWKSDKVQVCLEGTMAKRHTYWGKYTLINVERAEKENI